MFGITGRRHDPGNLRQGTVLHVAAELVEQVLGPGQPIRLGRPRAGDDVDDPGARRRVLEQRRVHRSRRVLIEVKYRIVAEVAGEGIACSVPEIRREGRPRQILVELPAHAGRLQHFG